MASPAIDFGKQLESNVKYIISQCIQMKNILLYIFKE